MNALADLSATVRKRAKLTFGACLEVSLRATLAGYEDLEARAKDRGIESKPFIARYVAEHLKADLEEEGWRHLNELADKLRALLAHSEPATDDEGAAA